MNHEKNDQINHDQITKTFRALSPVWGREVSESESERGECVTGRRKWEGGRKGEVNNPPASHVFLYLLDTVDLSFLCYDSFRKPTVKFFDFRQQLRNSGRIS